MKHPNIVYGSLVLAVILMVAFISFFLGDKRGVESISIQQATPNQLANAMQMDNFYSQYRSSTLIIQGTVQTIMHNATTSTIQFVTSTQYQTYCQMRDAITVKKGDALKVLTEGGQALRQSSSVLLKNCVIW